MLVVSTSLLLPTGAVMTRRVRSTCHCSGGLSADLVEFGVSGLLQEEAATGDDDSAKRPRDCTCINGMKTYQTTPKDELLGMGMLALGRHEASCERKLDGLMEEKEYAVADSEVKIKKAKEQMDQAQNNLANVKNATAKDRSQVRADKKEIMTEVAALEKEIVKLNSRYDKEFSAWWKLKDSMKVKLKQTNNCKCKKALLLQRFRKPPPGPDVYDTVRKVEECENKVIKAQGEIAKAQAAGRKATITAIEDRKKFGKSMADQQHLSKLLNQKPQVTALGKTKGNLENIVKARKEKVEKYKATNADIEENLKQLDSNLKKCGC